ncbi:hypothetical protein BDW22DRAFT_1314881, partial [Trametopsis cervina]
VLLVSIIVLQLATLVISQPPTAWTTWPFNPNSLPLAVKSPYLNAWAPLAGGSAALNSAWPRSYDPLGNILEWYASIRVDGVAYKLLGEADLPNVRGASQKSFIFTPTQSSYILDCGGKVNAEVMFVTPIEPTDPVRLSLPFSYLQITAVPSDGDSHRVEVYSDVSGAWVVGDLSQSVQWTVLEGDDTIALQMQPTSIFPFMESSNRPEDATGYYATSILKTASVSWGIGPSGDIRTSFAHGTNLTNHSLPVSSPVGPPSNRNNVAGFAIDLGTVPKGQDGTAVFALGLVRDPVIQYTNGAGHIENRTSYYWSQLPNINAVITNVITNYTSALASATTLDASLASAATPYGADYAALISLSTRQTMSALEYTLLRDPSTGVLNTSDIKVFMKDMGYVGTGPVNPVDVIYAAMPAYLYLNPRILGYLLNSLLDSQDSAPYPNPYAAPNIGDSWPIANGNSKPHNQGIEQSANMLIMALAHAQATGDTTLLSEHYTLLKSWASYLVHTALNPAQQVTSLSDMMNPDLTNQTNLALKGVVGIGAMGKISAAMGQAEDQDNFTTISTQYAAEWLSLALQTAGLPVEAFGSSNPGFLYNLYADALLGLNLIDGRLYKAQTAAFKLEGSSYQLGIPLDPPNTTARADWMLFAAAIVTDTSVRSAMIKQVANANSQSLLSQNSPFTVVYDASTGNQGAISKGSPAVGAMFAPLALTLPKQDITAGGGGPGRGTEPNEKDNGVKHRISKGAIAGAVLGSIAFTGSLVFLVIFYRKRKHTRRVEGGSDIHRVDEYRINR